MKPKVLLSRKTFFSASRRLWIEAWDESQNQAAFGKATQLHGHDYVVDAYYAGPVPKDDGMIANISELKPLLAEMVQHFDGKYLNHLPDFASALPTLENIVNSLWFRLPPTLGTGKLERIALEESRRLRILKTIDTMRLTRSYEFCAAHRLHSPALPETENMQRYGKCSNPAGHGHNYVLEVSLQGQTDAATGQLISLKTLDALIEKTIIDRFDHKHLNEDCPEFEGVIPTSENFARVIFDLLDPLLQEPHCQLSKIGLHETYKNYFEVER